MASAKMSKELRDARKFLFAAQRAVDRLKSAEDFSMSLDGVEESLKSAAVWIEEYTWEVMENDGTES